MMVYKSGRMIVKEHVKCHIKNVIDNYINYEWEGSDFRDQISKELDTNFWGLVFTKKELNQKLYDEFIDDLSEHIIGKLNPY